MLVDEDLQVSWAYFYMVTCMWKNTVFHLKDGNQICWGLFHCFNVMRSMYTHHGAGQKHVVKVHMKLNLSGSSANALSYQNQCRFEKNRLLILILMVPTELIRQRPKACSYWTCFEQIVLWNYFLSRSVGFKAVNILMLHAIPKSTGNLITRAATCLLFTTFIYLADGVGLRYYFSKSLPRYFPAIIHHKKTPLDFEFWKLSKSIWNLYPLHFRNQYLRLLW